MARWGRDNKHASVASVQPTVPCLPSTGRLPVNLQAPAAGGSLACARELKTNPHNPLLSTPIHKEKKKQKKKVPADYGSIPLVTFLDELTRGHTLAHDATGEPRAQLVNLQTHRLKRKAGQLSGTVWGHG